MANRRILLVEGKDDEHVLKHICGNSNIPELDGVIPIGDVKRLLSHIPVRLKDFNEEGDIVGIVIDADTDLTVRWQSIQQAFREAEYKDIPTQPNPNGTIFEPPGGSLLPRAGVWIMPDNRTPGILEHFLRFLVPRQNALFDHVDASVDSIPDLRFSQKDKPKAVIHTWLAWQKEPGRPYGTAITAHFLDINVPEVDVLASWLKELFFHEELTQ